jgi:hypothetical protein
VQHFPVNKVNNCAIEQGAEEQYQSKGSGHCDDYTAMTEDGTGYDIE